MLFSQVERSMTLIQDHKIIDRDLEKIRQHMDAEVSLTLEWARLGVKDTEMFAIEGFTVQHVINFLSMRRMIRSLAVFDAALREQVR